MSMEAVGGIDRESSPFLAAGLYHTRLLLLCRLDMTLPVIDIQEGAKEHGEFIGFFDGARDVWEEDIETYAPGYFPMEAQGNEADYDHGRLIDPNQYY